MDYRIYLKNSFLSSFSRLMEAAENLQMCQKDLEIQLNIQSFVEEKAYGRSCGEE